MSVSNEENACAMQMKPWQTPELKVLDVPSATLTGTGRLDPLENIFFYRPS